MDVREKLVDDVHSKLMGLLQRAPYIRCEDVHRQYAVNWLMNNGVTVQEWIPVTERLPPAGHRPYLTCRKTMSGRKIIETRYLQTSYFTPHVAYWEGKKNGEVTHWMPLPQPPKGE